MNRTQDKIRSFQDLPPGWHYGKGSAPGCHIVQLALDAEKLLRDRGYPETDAFPGTAGEIQVTGYLGGRCATIEISDELNSLGMELPATPPAVSTAH